MLVGLALAFLRDVFDDRMRDPAQLERRLGRPTLAVLPPAENRLGTARTGRGAQAPDPSPRSKSRTARRPSYQGTAGHAGRSGSAAASPYAPRRRRRRRVSSGRIAAELGVALAESGRRVLLVAADMRGSVIPQVFDLPDTAGLSDLLVGGGDLEALPGSRNKSGG